MVTIYTQPTCAPCKAVESRLDKAGIEYEKLDITTNPEARATITDAGFQSTPVIGFQGELVDISGLRAIIAKATA